MNKVKINYALDGLLMLLGVAVMITGLLLAFVIPRGRGWRGVTLAGLSRRDWADVHLGLAMMLTAAILVHLVLHWDWVYATTGRFLGWRIGPRGRGKWWSLAASLAGLAALVLGLLAAGRWGIGS